MVKIVPVAEANGTGAVDIGAGQPGFGVSIVPLHYTTAATIARTADSFLSRPGAIKMDLGRNLLLIQGTTAERQSALDLVSTFDVEWLRNQSVGVYPLKSTSPETMIAELERVFESGQRPGPGRGPLPTDLTHECGDGGRPDSQAAGRATQWVQRLDRSDTTGTTVRIYRLKYASAPPVAKVLNDIFVAQRAGQSISGDLPGDQIAPETSAAQSRLGFTQDR